MRKSRLSWYEQSRLMELFIAGTTARTTAFLVGVNKTTASYYLGLTQITHNFVLSVYEKKSIKSL